MSFKNKVVLVTGGSSGIGAATAVSFAKEGAKVAIVGRNEVKLNKVKEACHKHGAETLVIKADVSKDEEASNIIKKTIDHYGKLDILVNNAGIVVSGGLLGGEVMKTYDAVMNVNLRAVVNITCCAVPYLVSSKGNIINISSTSATIFDTSMLAYSTSKAGLEHFSKIAALELGPSGVRVNIVSPGPVPTDILESAGMPDLFDEWAKDCPLRKVAYPEEVADLILFLASNKAKSITGANFTIDNGEEVKGYS
uniref:Uncharacterized protein n=1 Tax=Heliothis virescens TaxID=7102 RepID=A0A2A4J612_HELVI